ncbi:MAG TPA: heme exporter protein CcmD [Burkholderiales bacterium]|nr:heme exporter protein CcmD [Burkholderiales bacterium]
MSWSSASEFFNMGGYAFYVWGSYVVTLGLLAAEALTLVTKERAAVSRLARERGRMEAQ